MSENLVKESKIRIEKGDLTLLDIEAIVFYAQPDLSLGSGYGNAIAVRGGMSIQEELNGLGPKATGEVVVTRAGNLNSNFIIHAVGPRFQEEEMENKLRITMQNILKTASEIGIRQIAFPPMGTGFYGIPLDLSARIMIETINEHLAKETSLEEVLICAIDEREYKPFQAALES
jgi:O-acetyl-ADP-ribose deacetylase (regulator of RNase III)